MSENSRSNENRVVERSFYLQDQRDISLVDVVAIACRQWKVAVSTFMILSFVVMVFALTLEKKYTYSSVYKVAEQQESDNNPLGALERPSAVEEKVRTLYMGGAVRTLLQTWGKERLDFSTDVNNPTDTLLIVLASSAAEGDAGHVRELHQRSLQQAFADQQAALERRQQSLEQRRRNLNRRLEALSDDVSGGELAATYADQLAAIDVKLADLTQGEIVQLAERSVKPVGLGRLWMLLFGSIVALIMALMSAWLAHFFGLVSNALRGNSWKR